MTVRVVVFAEDVLGMTLARDLSDRVVIERGPTWLQDLWREHALRDSQRAWSGFEPGDAWTRWTTAKGLPERRRVRTHGLGMRGYALVAYRAARLAATLQPAPDLAVFVIDTQGDDSMRAQMQRGLENARVEGLPFALAIAHQEAEAWAISGFVAESDAEKLALRDLETAHSFDPTREPHRLTPNRPTDPHDAKRVSKTLFPEGTRSPRAEPCWLETPLTILEERGARTGLPEFLADVRRSFGPVLGADPDHFTP